MSHPPPVRNRPNLHLELTQSSGSPRYYGQETPKSSFLSFSYPTPADTPLGKTAYSPFRSAVLEPPPRHVKSATYRPRRNSRLFPPKNVWYRVRRVLASKPVFLLFTILALTLWWMNGGGDEVDAVKLGASGLGKGIWIGLKMHDYQFFPASNPKIHYVGRWTSTPHRLRKDGTFSGVYFDIAIRNTTSLLLSLQNSPGDQSNFTASAKTNTVGSHAAPDYRHYHFHHSSPNEKPAAPVSLLARIDDQEYILLPRSSSLVSVCADDLDPSVEHNVRIVAPTAYDHGQSVVEFEGLWLSKGGKLGKVPRSMLSPEYVDEDLPELEDNRIGEKHRIGLDDIEKDGTSKTNRGKNAREQEEAIDRDRKKLLEVVTDSPSSFTGQRKERRTGGADGLLAGVTSWQYLLGEMFGADHVTVGVEGMCLTQDCLGGTGSPAGMGDVFFRSGPWGSTYFDQPWTFSAYVPDVLVLNLGGADDISFHEHMSDYNKTLWDLSEKFETTYVSIIKAIRTLAYPKHPSLVQNERSATFGSISGITHASIPIFVMRPLRGQLEQATQSAVVRLRADGDKAVFWIDTSGWLDLEVETPETADFFLDETLHPHRYRLTEQGNQRVAIFLHMHVCRYLADAEEKCAFLPQEVYQGKVFDSKTYEFDKYIEDEKERKLKKLFWETEGPALEGDVGV